jgi:hypothetical protein
MAAAKPRSTRAAKGGVKDAVGSAGQSSGAPCPVALCPICMTVTALGEVRPELVDHLLAAGREVLLAMRSVIDARLDETKPPVRLQRLTIE